MEKNKENMVHVYGTISNVSELEAGKATKFIIRLTSQESWLKDKDLDAGKSENYDRRDTHIEASYVTSLQNEIDKYRLIGRNCEENWKNWNKEKGAFKEGYVPHQPVKVSIDGRLISYNSTQKKDGEPLFIVVDGKEQALSCKHVMVAADEIKTADKRQVIGQNADGGNIKEPNNKVEIKGNISHIEKIEGKTQEGKDVSSYIVTLVSKYLTNETVKDENGKESRKLVEKSSNFEVRVTKKNIAEGKYNLYHEIESGKIGVGDLVSFTGQLHNNSYDIEAQDAKGNKVSWTLNKMVIDSGLANLLHKAEKKAEAPAEAKAEAPAEEPKKAQPKKGMHM